MTITPLDLAAVSRLLDALLDLPEADRDAWLAALAGPGQAHVPRLRETLAVQSGAGSQDFLGALPRLGEPEASSDDVAAAGELVGPYRLIREIGRGGMGAVWLAERVDGALQRRVALKLPRLAWGTGLAERMKRERDIGALLEHPHIARLYDAGVDPRGRPYLAFEHIDGQDMDAYCDTHGLDVPERLRLVVQGERLAVPRDVTLSRRRRSRQPAIRRLVSASGAAATLRRGCSGGWEAAPAHREGKPMDRVC